MSRVDVFEKMDNRIADRLVPDRDPEEGLWVQEEEPKLPVIFELVSYRKRRASCGQLGSVVVIRFCVLANRLLVRHTTYIHCSVYPMQIYLYKG